MNFREMSSLIKGDKNGVSMKQSPHSAAAGEVAVVVDVAKVDAAWKNDSDYYLPAFENGGKYVSARNDILGSGSATMPRAGLLDDGARVGFDDGRHTFAVLRDMGRKKIHLSVDASQAEDFRRLFS